MATRKTLDPLDIAMINLHTIPDTKLSEIIGVSTATITRQRDGSPKREMTQKEKERHKIRERAARKEIANMATRSYAAYTMAEDEIILHSKKTDVEIAKMLHRSLKAIVNRRARLLGKAYL